MAVRIADVPTILRKISAFRAHTNATSCLTSNQPTTKNAAPISKRHAIWIALMILAKNSIVVPQKPRAGPGKLIYN